MASAVCGEPRSTLDVDLVVSLSEGQIPGLVASLQDDFRADAQALRRAVRQRSSTNVVHLATSIKVDLFIMGGSPVDAEQMDRRQRIKVVSDPDRYLYVYTPEDILLQKLRWYRLGNEVSDRQWRDILGILLVQGNRLDKTYLSRGAEKLGVADLLGRAMTQAGDPST